MKIRSVIAAALLALVMATAAKATIIRPVSLQKMTSGSDAIVVGRIESQSSRTEGNIIVTDVVVSVSEFLKAADSNRPAQIGLRVLGGQVGDLRMEVDMSPRFDNGEEVLLFLRKKSGAYVPFGFSYGVYKIGVAGDGLTPRVNGPLFQAGQVYDEKSKTMVGNTVPMGGEALSTFKSRVGTALLPKAE